ncbi:MAG: hypothetical protein UZ15_CFX003002539 [Chloroflexi bacterium OLB15]|nr:MAG: hypothetical protein UZ15_CFX003002539 [Chloroflexi bacterium OLB15]
MAEKERVNLMFALWFLSAIVLAALFISAAAQGEMTAAHVALALVILGMAVAGTTYLLRQKAPEIQRPDEKTKRHSVLDDLSDEEVAELKQRLAESGYSVDALVKSLGDDGETTLRR